MRAAAATSSLSLSLLLIFLSLSSFVNADLFLHSPRGSNNKVSEGGERRNAQRLFDSENNARGGYCWGPAMSYVEGSILPIEWTSTHTCTNGQATCTEVIQYMCTDTSDPNVEPLRDGTSTTTIDELNRNDKNGDGTYVNGLHEPLSIYQNCRSRTRNKGLYTGVESLNNAQGAMATRQNSNGFRHGFECSEESDYYPYWHPAAWKDVAIFTSEPSLCPFYQQQSQNVLAKNFCSNQTHNNQADCVASGAQWTSSPSFGLSPPECFPATSASSNIEDQAILGDIRRYNWKVPRAATESCISSSSCNCAIRIRYNVTSAEFSGVTGNFIDSRNNTLYMDDPVITFEGQPLQLALDTAQTGRVFQDRSFMFHISPRASSIPSTANIYNLNVRGKRGNVVQAFPATEYDFVPANLQIKVGDYVHYQWTGCATNQETGSTNVLAGEGLRGTDVSNIIQIAYLNSNIPLDILSTTVSNPLFEDVALRLRMGYLNQQGCLNRNELTDPIDQDLRNCMVLNAAGSYFDGGVIPMNRTGTFAYMSTRNNNFSNRFQKGTITVSN